CCVTPKKSSPLGRGSWVARTTTRPRNVVRRPKLDFYDDGSRVNTVPWEEISIDALPAIAFSHPHLQETLLTWAASQGATVLRPAKVVGVRDGNRPSVTVVEDGRTTAVQARLRGGRERADTQ